MVTNIRRFFLLTVALLFCVLGCARDRADVLMPDHVSPPMEVHEPVDVKASFEHDLLPILTARCALSGCHVADGPHGLDFRTYESFIAGGEHGPAYIPGNASESEIIEEIVEGKMPPPPRDPLSAAEIQLFVDWINQQESQDGVVKHDEAHDEVEDAHEDHDDGAPHEDMDEDDHGDDVHDDHEDEHEDMDNDDAHDDGDDHDDDNEQVFRYLCSFKIL